MRVGMDIVPAFEKRCEPSNRPRTHTRPRYGSNEYEDAYDAERMAKNHPKRGERLNHAN